MHVWNITHHAYATSTYCDAVTRTAIEDAITADVFDCVVGGNGMAAGAPLRRRFTIPRVDAVDGEPQQVGNLPEFIGFSRGCSAGLK